MYSSRLYRSAPPALQELLLDARWLGLRAMRTSAPYARYLADVRETQWLGEDELATMQRERLDRVIAGARDGCRHYRTVFARLGVDSAADLARIPILTREDVRLHAEQIASDRFKGWRIRGSTSGTSGTPLRLTKSLTEIRYEAAFYQRQLDWAGHREGDRLAWLRGDRVVDPSSRTPPFWLRSRLGRTLYLSSYHLAEENAARYLEALERFRPHLIQAYPSSIGFLANYLEAVNRTYGQPLKGIVTSSETLLPEVREVIERRFGARVFDWYGSYERVAAIGTCERGRYHVLSDYGYVEIVPGPGGEFELIGTSFHNPAFPLIRYRTGDQVALDHGPPCGCGRHFPTVARVLGRQDDLVKTPSGRRIGRLDHVFKGARGVLEAKIVQDDPARLTILVVTGGEFSPADERAIEEKARTLTGGELAIELSRVGHIERGSRGKHQLVECNV